LETSFPRVVKLFNTKVQIQLFAAAATAAAVDGRALKVALTIFHISSTNLRRCLPYYTMPELLLLPPKQCEQPFLLTQSHHSVYIQCAFWGYKHFVVFYVQEPFCSIIGYLSYLEDIVQ
jgi:hypothetical protein